MKTTRKMKTRTMKMSKTLNSSCFYCNKITTILENMIKKDELTKENVWALCECWSENHDITSSFGEYE